MPSRPLSAPPPPGAPLTALSKTLHVPPRALVTASVQGTEPTAGVLPRCLRLAVSSEATAGRGHGYTRSAHLAVESALPTATLSAPSDTVGHAVAWPTLPASCDYPLPPGALTGALPAGVIVLLGYKLPLPAEPFA